jgi:hypothetical protein
VGVVAVGRLDPGGPGDHAGGVLKVGSKGLHPPM